MATVDELVVRIKADATQLERELKRVGQVTQQETQRMGKSFDFLKGAALGFASTLSVGLLVNFASKAIDAAGRMNDLAAQTGFAASTLSTLEKSLATNGASLDQFAASINLMNANIGSAVSGNDALAEKFNRLGISVEDLQKLSPEEQFYAIADALARVGTQYEQTELGRAIFGRGFAALIPLIKEANGDLGESVETLKELGEGLSDETIARIDAFGDSLQAAGIKAQNAFLEAFAAVLQLTDAIGNAQVYGEQVGGGLRDVFGLGPKPDPVGDWMAKAKAGGFATEITRGTVISGQPYGPNLPKEQALSRTRVEGIKKQTIATKELTDAEKAFLDAAQETADEFARQQQEMQRQTEMTARVIKDYLGDAFESALFDAESFGDAASGILNGIARQLARTGFIDPLSEGLSGIIKDNMPSLGDFFGGFFAEGGRPPVGVPSVVGERGAEIFVPDTAGTIIPNNKLGGTTLYVSNTWNVSPGVQGTVRQELMQAAPGIVNQSVNATLAAIERGGSAAMSVGRRS